MDLLDRYLQAVKKHLPWERQDDIIAELRSNLESQLEDKEAELGRPLTAAEADAWLKQIGPPKQVAARYQPQRYLIGPAIFPSYWTVLRIVLSWALVIYLIATVAQVFAAGTLNGTAVVVAALRVPWLLINAAAWVTAIFAAIEFAARHNLAKFPTFASTPGDWSPTDLPPVELQAAHGEKPRTYAQAVTELVIGFLFLGWLLLVPKYPFVLMGPGAAYLQASPFKFAPVWWPIFWSMVALSVLQLVWRSVDLLRGSWRNPQTVQQSIMSVLGLVPMFLLLNAGDHAIVLLKHPELDQARYGQALHAINQSIYIGALWICALVGAKLLWKFAQMMINAWHKRAAPSQ